MCIRFRFHSNFHSVQLFRFNSNCACPSLDRSIFLERFSSNFCDLSNSLISLPRNFYRLLVHTLQLPSWIFQIRTMHTLVVVDSTIPAIRDFSPAMHSAISMQSRVLVLRCWGAHLVLQLSFLTPCMVSRLLLSSASSCLPTKLSRLLAHQLRVLGNLHPFQIWDNSKVSPCQAVLFAENLEILHLPMHFAV